MDEERPVSPLGDGGPVVNLEQAAFIMQVHPEQLLGWIREGLVLTIKRFDTDDPSTIRIHQTELDRFRHPWKHIWRLDKRIDSQQKLVETLKQRINNAEITRDLNRISEAQREQDYRIEMLENSGAEMANRKADDLNEAMRDIESQIKSLKQQLKQLKEAIRGRNRWI